MSRNLTMRELYTLRAELPANAPEFIAHVAESFFLPLMCICLIPD